MLTYRVNNTVAAFTLDDSATYAEIIQGTSMGLVVTGFLYLGGVPENINIIPEAVDTAGFVGCIDQFEEDGRNSYEFSGVNVINCNVSACQEFMCENGGSCVLNSSSLMGPTCSCPEVSITVIITAVGLS